MPTEARSIPLLLAIALSLIIHASTAFVIARQPLRHVPPAAEHLVAPEDAEDQWQLGIDRTTTKTAIAWIGYDTFRAMNAPRSTAEQAAQTKQAPTPMPIEEVADATPPPTPPVPDAAAARAAARQITQAVDQAAHVLDQATAQVLDLARSLAGTLALPMAAAATKQPAEPTPAQQVAEQPAPPTKPTPPTPTTAAAAPEPGELAERESLPSTTLPDAKANDLGQPIAAQGIIIQTVRPRFSHYIQLTADPKDPLVRIHFDRGGRVVWVDLAESSGYQAVDEPIKAAVYRWRATGEALQTMEAEKPDQVLIVTLRILL